MSRIDETKCRLYPEAAVGGFSRVDGTIEFYNRVNALLREDMVLVDLGAGRGSAHTDDPVEYRRKLRSVRGRCRRVIGLDVDDAICNNPSLDEAYVIPSHGRFPIADESVDLVFSDATFEHVEDPARFAAEIHRVLKRSGWICARTPNRFGYIGLGANLVPNQFHAKLLQVLQPDRKEADVFPTAYRLNTFRALRHHFPEDKWARVIYTWNAEPAYFGSSETMWRLVQLAFRLTPEYFGSTLLFFARKL
jgi:SAM-dependent methyltransferase